MKIFLLLLAALLFAPSSNAQTLLEKRFQLTQPSEVRLELTAVAPETDWAVKGREAAVGTLYVDGAYQQDVIFFAGPRKHTYRVLLGRLAPGDHTLRVTLNARQSAPNDARVVIHEALIAPVTNADRLEAAAYAHAPIVYARPDTVGKFSDAPLLMWYEFAQNENATVIRYSIIFSNEDGGTQTAALMARWGRATDIEWVYEVKLDASGKIVEETFQGTDHRILPFKGRREARRPLLAVASVNNNFSARIPGAPALRFALCPLAFDAGNNSREALMDLHPWTYRVMADELKREGRIARDDAEIAGTAGLGMKIADPRCYLYFDAGGEQKHAALSFAVKLKGDPRWYASDLGASSFRIARDGWFRTTVRMPARIGLDAIEQVVARCDAMTEAWKQTPPATPLCGLDKINKLFLLDEDFRPVEPLRINLPALALGFGEAQEIYRATVPASAKDR